MRLSIAGVDCAYNHIPVLAGVTLEVGEGEFIGVIGPNGSGKTTLLRTIAGILRPRVGTVLLDDTSLVDARPRQLARLVGVVPQRSSVPFDFTARELVLMGRIAHQDRFDGETERDAEAVRRAMESARCEHFADRPFASLSGGEQQRVLIARALAQQPRVLLLDEPTAHLDLGAQLEILSLIRRICAQQKLIVIAVFHDLNLAARFAARLVLMNTGKVERIGGVEEVLQPDNLERVYGCRVRVDWLPDMPYPVVTAEEGDP